MSDSQRFAVATHVLVYLASRGADCVERRVPSRILAQTVPTNAVVVRRATASLGRTGLIAARVGAGGGAWLLKPASAITLDAVLNALEGGLHLGLAGPAAGPDRVVRGLPAAINAALSAADEAVRAQLASVSIKDLLERARAEIQPTVDMDLEAVCP